MILKMKSKTWATSAHHLGVVQIYDGLLPGTRIITFYVRLLVLATCNIQSHAIWVTGVVATQVCKQLHI